MVGETLEQHCEIEFNKIRATSFPSPISRKITTLGQVVRRLYFHSDENGVEILSIAFEMKNESDNTATKKKMRISSKSLIKTETRRAASTQFWSRC